MGVISHIGDPAQLDPGQGRGYASQLSERPWLRAADGRLLGLTVRRVPTERRAGIAYGFVSLVFLTPVFLLWWVVLSRGI